MRLAAARGEIGGDMTGLAKRALAFPVQLNETYGLLNEEVFRLGVLRDGIQLITRDIRFPMLGQVIPRIEIEISGSNYRKKVTVRINPESAFMFDGETLSAHLNGALTQVACAQYVDEGREATGMYNFGMTRENGIRSFVFDYHTYCCYSCDFCFKENEWEVLSIEGSGRRDYKGNFQRCLDYVDENQAAFRADYDIVWLCTGSIKDAETELQRHCQLAERLRAVGYKGGIYLSQVVPERAKTDRVYRREMLMRLREAGVSRFNTGIEIVNSDVRRKYISGFKANYTFDDYVRIFADTVEEFGRFGAGSCLLAGIEKSDDTINGLRVISELGVVPSPTVFTPFVVKQTRIPFEFDLQELLRMHVRFNEIVKVSGAPVFSGVFSLA